MLIKFLDNRKPVDIKYDRIKAINISNETISSNNQVISSDENINIELISNDPNICSIYFIKASEITPDSYNEILDTKELIDSPMTDAATGAKMNWIDCCFR